MRATDAHGNQSTQNAIVRVFHDQGQQKCDKIDPSRIVADDDPRCTANMPLPLSRLTTFPPPGPRAQAADHDDKSVAANGCSAASRNSPEAGGMLVIAVLLAFSRRRRTGRQ